MKYWVALDGSLGKGEDLEPNAIEIDAGIYCYFLENQGLLNIRVVDGRVESEVDIVSYRRAALARLTPVNFIVYRGQKIYDDELGYLSDNYIMREGGPCRITKEQMIRLVTERNRQYTLRRSGIQTARTPEEVDGYLTCPTI
uniref:Uncharacterized protein n=1 Tax=Pseudomonas phage HRDY3 TaxID=3236930 RepID=A0AB39CDX4_9VIRU